MLIARFVAGLRIAIAWLAGLSKMPWLRFLAYNAAGGILWATTYGLAAYYFGQAAVDAVEKYGFFAVIVDRRRSRARLSRTSHSQPADGGERRAES